ncbi:MAG: type II secretion system secretin GspD [Polyangiaceae bacterium]|nr:type II secretion system secretin GspD [Polyangiaceae bacterium]
MTHEYKLPRDLITAPNTTAAKRRFGYAAAVALGAACLVTQASQTASAQTPTRGAPILRTPNKPAAPGANPATPGGAGTAGRPPGAAPTAPAPPPPSPGAKPPSGAGAGAGAGGDDPMASVKQAPKEIEFKPKGLGTPVNFNLDDADLPDLVKAISNITGRRFIYGGKLRSIKATVYSPDKITAGEAYAAFLSILQQNQMTVVPHGRFLKIVDSQGIVSESLPLFAPASPVPGEERYVTRMYRVSHVDATEVSTLLGKFKSKDGDISVYSPGNLLIITDTGTQIQRLLRIVEEIDVGGAGDQLWVEPIHYGGASDIATKLNEILDLKGGAGGKGGKGGPGAKIVPDDRTNSLIITATQADYMRLLKLIERIDVPQTGEGELHVLPLQHAGCKDLSNTLSNILGRSGASGAAAGGATGARGKATAGGAASGGEDIFEGQIKVVCDEASNKLVVTASPRDYAQLRNVIDQLDMPRRQVFIEAVIMDVGVDRDLNLGIGYHGGGPIANALSKDDTFLYGGNNPGQSVTGLPADLEGLAIGVRGPSVTELDTLFPGLSIPAFGVVLHAVGRDGNTNVLATPHILATDNIPAEISIGQNIPLQTNVPQLGQLGNLLGGAGGAGAAAGLLGGLGGFGGGLGSGRQDVGTKIKVTPHINDSDQVRLELNEEISEAGTAIGTLGAVPINKRTADTTLIVRDQQTVVIGGLVRDSTIERQTKIPVLGDLPVLGALFRQSIKTVQKTNLLLVLTPYIVRNQDDLRAIFERKMQERQEFIDRYLVFSDSRDWEPPRDFSRANGLVEDIRQSMLDEDDKARLIEESKPKGPRTHTPGEPIALPQLGGKSGGTGASAGGDDGGGTVPAASGTTRPANPRPKLPANLPRVDRVEQ